MPAGILLAIAIASEVAATISLRYADGFSRPLPSTIVVLGYALSFWLLSLVLRDIPVGTTYAIWAGAGTAAIAVIGMARARRARDRAEDRLDRADHPRRHRAQRLRRALMPRPSRRTALLDAALTVVRRDGAAALTLDAVAAEAGVSKGGVLYHFGSKRALIDGLLERWLDEFGARLAGPGFAAAYVRASEVTGPENAASEFGMLAAMIEDPPSSCRCANATPRGWTGSWRTCTTRSTPGWCDSRPTVCGIPISSASPPPRAPTVTA